MAQAEIVRITVAFPVPVPVPVPGKETVHPFGITERRRAHRAKHLGQLLPVAGMLAGNVQEHPNSGRQADAGNTRIGDRAQAKQYVRHN